MMMKMTIDDDENDDHDQDDVGDDYCNPNVFVSAAFYEDIALDDEDYTAVKGIIMAETNATKFELQVEDPGIHTRGPASYVPEPKEMYREQTLKDKKMLKQILKEKKLELKSKCLTLYV